MTVRGKNINLFLLDGGAGGRWKCTMGNWSGLCFKIPRTMLDECSSREDLKQSGVYFLFGISDETDSPVVYVGQAGSRKNGEGILYRLKEHRRNPKKDYWTEAVAFTTSSNFFGPTEISYLEHRFCQLAHQAGRYEVKNGNDPAPGNLTEEKISEMEDFIDTAKTIMMVLGHNMFEPVSAETISFDHSVKKDGQNLFLSRTFKNGESVTAYGKQTAEGFAVLKGSRIASEEDETISAALSLRRKKAQLDNQRILIEDELFSSPSSAAVFVNGKSTNGLTAWKTADGRTLKSLEAENSEERNTQKTEE